MKQINLEELPDNKELFDSFLVTKSKLEGYDPEKIMVAISGGADSDIMLDLVHRICDGVHYVFFDTGLEYEATKEHIKYLEEKYGIEIEVEKAKKAIPTTCKQYGQPFISKRVSELMERLQRHGFQWEDEPLDVLLKRYQKCKAALRWWCNDFPHRKYNIQENKWLKEFLIAHPPTFRISNKCCQYAKKDAGKDYKKRNEIQLSVVGIRKAEGGARATIKNCFTPKDDAPDEYRPLFWYKNETKTTYETFFCIEHSRCYSEYGLRRTGCAGCPFGRNFEKELEIIAEHEPKLLAAVNNIFRDTYAYTRQYREFARQMNEGETK